MRSEIRDLSERQDGVFARWQLRRPQHARVHEIDWLVRDGLRSVFPGVYVTGWGPVTQQQMLRAGTLTAPSTSLHVASAAGLHAIRTDPGLVVTVVRPGCRGANHARGLRVAYSSSLADDLVTVNGISTTSVERTLVDLWPHLTAPDRSRMLREALRIGRTTPVELLGALHRHRRRPGAAELREELLGRLHLPFDRCRSPAEAMGLVVLDEAGVEIPLVNEKIAGLEADFTWLRHRRIVEIDGPQWHRFAEEDARKTEIWEQAGFDVRRIPSDDVFADPAALLRLAPPPAR